ncbi:hypothetical protein L227DRAFT_616830 [Lentinus tigrinus ALCF2SS1-6]|uniref:HNH nuclease domain-containing protein n=1 Tax=Lentinus tigrinus ALCF2SS1-6 TaxID=1328759 RepID=A0A5C2RT07_9APHY|nr:hypothetical protein L227DRAFT_616830 [Lentinus tigrinus ALCF2SS1-6]
MPLEVLVLVLPLEAIAQLLLFAWDFLLGLLRGDLQWPSWLTSAPMWTLSDRSLPAYIKLEEVASTIVNDPRLTDYALEQRARAHLRILERPELAKWNHPQWLAPIASSMKADRLVLEKLVSAVTAQRFFEAMIQTANEFNLRSGRRHACAEVCACVRLAQAAGPLHETWSDRVALELNALLFTVWFQTMWETFMNIDGGKSSCIPWSADCAVRPSRTRKRVRTILRRDHYTCFMSGTVDRQAAWFRRVSAKTVGRLYIVPIFARLVTDDPSSDQQRGCSRPALDDKDDIGPVSQYQILHFFRTFGQIAHDGAQVPELGMPQNCLLLDFAAQFAFRQLQWTLVATAIPNTYKIRSYASPDGARSYGTRHIHEYVTFTEPTGTGHGGRSKTQGTLPNPDLLRAHAIFANVVHLSGLGFMLDPERWLPGSTAFSRSAGH